jgi:hypothetical protein
MTHVMNTYARQPVAFSHGEGSWVVDTEGQRYRMPYPVSPSIRWVTIIRILCAP